MQLSIRSDDYFLEQALKEAQKAFDAQEVPIGCVIVRDSRIIARGHNQMESLKDPTAHAEILAIGAACNQLDNWRLDGCTLYVTLEPCPMCAGAILNSRISKVVYGCRDKRLGALGSTYDILEGNPINREVEVVHEAMSHPCLEIIKEFFRNLRRKNKEWNLESDPEER